MSKEKKQGLLDISVMTVKVVLYFLLVVNAFVFVCFGIINRSDVLEKEPFQTVDDWTVSDDEEGHYVLSTVLSDNVEDNEYLYFNTRKDAEVYVGGELRKDFKEKRDVNIPGGAIRQFYMMTPLKEADKGKELRIVKLSSLESERFIPDSFITTRFGAFSHMMRREGISYVLASIVLIFSLVVIIVSFVLEFCYKRKIDMMYGALGIFVISFWLVTDSYMFPLIFSVYHVNGLLSYLFCNMIPFAPAIYLNSLQRGRYKRVMSILMIGSAINALLWPILHFTGIFPYYNAINIMNVILVIMSVTAILVLIIDAVKKRIGPYKYTFIGLFGFLVFCMISLIIALVDTEVRDNFQMGVGLAFLLVFVVIQQIDDLRKMNLEKQQAIDMSNAKTRFLASMSHEIRTPINSILGMNEMILRENTDETIGEYSRSIKSSGKMLLMLVNDVLDFSKIEAGKLEINENRFLMSDMMYDVISLVKERADEKQLDLSTELTANIPDEIISDEFRIRQILVNLINNAIKYTDKGYISVMLGGEYTGDEGYELSIRIKDTGKGITREDQEHLFEAFSRADIKSNVNIEGTGLGLAIVKSIVDSMKGSLGVESEYGFGSEFWVKLPVRYTGEALLRDDFMQRSIDYNTDFNQSSFMAPDAQVLAVDDNQSNLTIVKLFLKKNGITPDLCGSGSKAIELCKEKKYDLILLDHMMPDPDGIETLRMIKEDEASLNRDTKAIVLTANAVAGSRKMYIDAGFDDYITKPLDSNLLEKTVKEMLPEDKIKEVEESSATSTEKKETTSIRQKLSNIEGMDFETALIHCADDEELLAEIISDAASDSKERSKRMRKNLETGNIKDYGIDAHTIKSTMATLGLNQLSEIAKNHEFAAKNSDVDFIKAEGSAFIDKYEDICRKLGEELKK